MRLYSYKDPFHLLDRSLKLLSEKSAFRIDLRVSQGPRGFIFKGWKCFNFAVRRFPFHAMCGESGNGIF